MIGFGICAELLALVFAVIGWRHLAGKVAAIGVGILLVLAAMTFARYFSTEREWEPHERFERAKEAVDRTL